MLRAWIWLKRHLEHAVNNDSCMCWQIIDLELKLHQTLIVVHYMFLAVLHALIPNPSCLCDPLGNIEIYKFAFPMVAQYFGTQVIEILPCGRWRQWLAYPTHSIPWLLMAWWSMEPGHQQPWYWLSSSRIFQAPEDFISSYKKSNSFEIENIMEKKVIQEFVFENIVHRMVAILSSPQQVHCTQYGS